jgi:hypothetical protein
MEKSAIAKAFIKAKKQFAPAIKASLNPHYKSKYADLAACIEAVDDAFLDNGIVMYQETTESPGGITIETIFLHESGIELRCGKLYVPAQRQDPQAFGSALSYGRRYSLMAACGIAPEDDDGNEATRPERKPVPKPAPKTPERNLTSEAQRKRLFALGHEHGWDNDHIKDYIGKEFGLESTKELDQLQYNVLCAEIMKSPKVK